VANMKQLSCTMLQYACDNENTLPFTVKMLTVNGKKKGILWWRADPGSPLAPKYIKEIKNWVICPSYDRKKLTSQCSYQKQYYLGKVTDRIGKKTTERILLTESNEKGAYGGFTGKAHFDRLGFPHDGGTNVLLVNGEVQWMTPWKLYSSIRGRINYALSEKLRNAPSKRGGIKIPKIFSGNKELISAYSSFLDSKAGDGKQYDYNIAIKKLEPSLQFSKDKRSVFYLLSFCWLMKGDIEKSYFYAQKLGAEKSTGNKSHFHSLLKDYIEKLAITKESEQELERLRFALLVVRKLPQIFNQLQQDAQALKKLTNEPPLQSDSKYENILKTLEKDLQKLINEWQMALPFLNGTDPESWRELRERAQRFQDDKQKLLKENTMLKMSLFWKKKGKGYGIK